MFAYSAIRGYCKYISNDDEETIFIVIWELSSIVYYYNTRIHYTDCVVQCYFLFD